jgi:hypothetical protein
MDRVTRLDFPEAAVEKAREETYPQRWTFAPMGAGEALDVIRRQVVQLFHQINTGEFLLLLVGSGQCDISHLLITPRDTPTPPYGTGERNTIKPEETRNANIDNVT